MSVKIISDSTCDLSPELIERYGIHVVPLHIVLGETEYNDGVDITPDEIYAWSNENNLPPKTSALGLEEAVTVFSKYLDEGMDIVCFAISQCMSTTINVMRMAIKELGAENRISVINSKNLSTGVGLQVIEAAIMAAEGKTKEEITAHIEEIRPRVRASFVVDTLTFLHRGGRCSSVAAFAGSALRLHPRIAVTDGKMAAGKKYMGNISRVIMSYAKEMEADLLKAKKDRVFITHSGCSDEIIENVRVYLEGLGYFDEILITRAGGVVSSHCGPNTLGVLFIAGEE
ncbi:MAG: DegV family protein [Clostridia bacterium]|nr:DegV family protein [Clostridia bacterium]